MIILVLFLNLLNLALMMALVLGIFTSLVKLTPALIIAVFVSMLVTKITNVKVLKNASRADRTASADR